MSGRGGRGGGGGGGGGAGRISSTFTHDQLQVLGCVGNKDLSNSNTMNNTPPPIYPVLQSRPLPLETGPARDFKIQWKERFLVNVMQKKIHTKYQNNEFLWDLIPNELRPNLKRKQINNNNNNNNNNMTDINKKKIHLNSSINIEEKFNVLEAREQQVRIKDEPNIKEEKHSDDDADDDDDERRQQQRQQKEQQPGEPEEEEEIDEEMDEDNDYGFSYFDNGDAYANDEDDNLDDGPIY